VHRTPGPIACRYVRVPCRTPAGRGGMESSVSLLAVAHSPAAARALSDYQHRAMSTRLHFVTQRVLALRRRRGRPGRSARVWPDSEPAPRDPHGTGSLRSLDAFAAEGRFRRDRASSDPNRLSGGVPPGHWSWDTGVVHEALPTGYPAARRTGALPRAATRCEAPTPREEAPCHVLASNRRPLPLSLEVVTQAAPRTRKPRCSAVSEALCRTRTGDPFLTMEVLYQLS
jgi:hypothetical protein